MTKTEALTKMKDALKDLPQLEPLGTHQILHAYHHKYGGKPAVIELGATFGVTCSMAPDFCMNCATESVNRAMEALGEEPLAEGFLAPGNETRH